MRIPPRDGPKVVSWMAIIALRPAARSAQKTTCSWSSAYIVSKRDIITPSHGHENVVAIDHDFELLLHDVRIVSIHASRDIIFPSVPRAGNDSPAQFAFTQWSPLMRANTIDGIVSALHIEDGNLLPFNLDALALTGWDLTSLGHFDEIGHAALLLGP